MKVKVVHDPINQTYDVLCRKWWSPVWEEQGYHAYTSEEFKQSAMEKAIKRADSMAERTVVYKK